MPLWSKAVDLYALSRSGPNWAKRLPIGCWGLRPGRPRCLRRRLWPRQHRRCCPAEVMRPLVLGFLALGGALFFLFFGRSAIAGLHICVRGSDDVNKIPYNL